MKSFKHNFYTCTGRKKYFNIESMEWVEDTTEVKYFPCHSEKKFKKTYNIFVDEASMISDVEMQDLLASRKMLNLVLDGDSLQFDPIGNCAKIEKEYKVVDEWIDDGNPYTVPVDHQILLNKSMRARDEKLVKALNYIKAGQLLEGITTILSGQCPQLEYKKDDWNICYTNKLCDIINDQYKNPTRMIVAKDDKIHGFYTSEILELDDERFEVLKRTLTYESLEGKKVPDFETWKQIHLKPAYAITCHKMQGSTISEGNIFIHLKDIIYGLKQSEYLTEEMRANLLQKFLYVAISRAVCASQINIMGIGADDFYHSYNNCPWTKDGHDGWKPVDGTLPLTDEIIALEQFIGPMVDTSIQEDAITCAADDDYIIDMLLQCLEYDTSKASTLQGEEAAKQKYREDRRKYKDDMLLNMSWEEVSKVTKDAGVRKRWRKLHNKKVDFGSRCQIANIYNILRSRQDICNICNNTVNIPFSFRKKVTLSGDLGPRFSV